LFGSDGFDDGLVMISDFKAHDFELVFPFLNHKRVVKAPGLGFAAAARMAGFGFWHGTGNKFGGLQMPEKLSAALDCIVEDFGAFVVVAGAELSLKSVADLGFSAFRCSAT
jgi:hypothetical protein